MADTTTNTNHSNLYSTFLSLSKYVLVFLAVRSLANYFLKPQIVPADTQSDTTLTNAWLKDQNFDFQLHYFDPQSLQYTPLLSATDLSYRPPDETPNFTAKIDLSPFLRPNATSFPITVTFCRSGLSSRRSAPNYDPFSFTAQIDLIKMMSPAAPQDAQNLLFGEKRPQKLEDAPKTSAEEPFLSKEAHLRLIFDQSHYKANAIPANLRPFITAKQHKYVPIFYYDDFWSFKEDLLPLRAASKPNLTLSVTMGTTSLYKFILKTHFEQSFDAQKKMFGAMDDERESFKRILRDTNPYFLALTVAVSSLHLVFEVLAFKNEIAFWKNKSDTHGLSVRSIFIDLFSSIIIALYLYENETSWMIVFSSFFSVGLYIWKLKRVFSFKLNLSGETNRWISIDLKQHESAAARPNASDAHDKVAVKYLCWALLPLVVGYSAYSLVFEEYRGWYQWILSSLVGSVYTFGFITMCPQLYINYKLKSVAHLPWRMMTYKALNTVIDDLFAFIIKMPTLHRISCFRDDAVFAVFLFQKWKYGVDYSRTNEFGYTPPSESKSISKNVAPQSKEKNE